MASYDILAAQAAHTLQDTEDDMHPGSITNKLLWPRDDTNDLHRKMAHELSSTSD